MSVFSQLRHSFKVFAGGLKNLPNRLRLPEPEPETIFPLEYQYRIALHFADSEINIYQMRQWYKPFQKLNEFWPVIIIARNAQSANLLMEESGLPVVFMPNIGDIEELLLQQPIDLMFYVNQNIHNFQLMRFTHHINIFINHGESDKKYMTSGQLKSYDYTFVAGAAAQKRLSSELFGYDAEQRAIIIGRPQFDFLNTEPPYRKGEHKTILYAPTWEGDRPSMEYGSIVSHGIKIAKTVINDTDFRFVYRPHPRSGAECLKYKEANDEIIRMIDEANKNIQNNFHIFDQSTNLDWQIVETDLVISDISAVLYDRLFFQKPLLVTKPISKNAEIDDTGYLGACKWLETQELDKLHSIIMEELDNDEHIKTMNYWSDFYFDKRKNITDLEKFVLETEKLLQENEHRRIN